MDIFKAEMLKTKAGNFEATIRLSEECVEDITWWIENTHTQSRALIRADPTVVITSDSSDYAWGGTRDDLTTGGAWSETEKGWHINVKEMLAALRTLCSLCDQERAVHIRMKLDNMNCVLYLNKRGGRRRALNEVTRKIWFWALERDIWLSAEHLPGVQNVRADKASRQEYANEAEWQLDPHIFTTLNERFGPFQIDLFATRIITQCETYFAWKPDPHAIAIDAFAHNWEFELIYAFPPFSLIGRTLAKLELEGRRAVVIAPLWPSQACPMIEAASCERPLPLIAVPILEKLSASVCAGEGESCGGPAVVVAGACVVDRKLIHCVPL